MPRLPTPRAGLLDLAAGIGLSGPAVMVLYSFDARPPWIIVSVVALLALAVGLWVVWRRSGQRSRGAAIAFAGVAVATMALGNGPLFNGIIWAACLMLGLTFAATAVLWSYAAGLVGLVVVLHTLSGSSAERTAIEAVATLFAAGLAAAVGAVLRDSIRASAALHEALVQLDAANDELRERLDSDRELVLAHERERTARGLHDDLGHRLTAIGLSLDYAVRVGDEAASHAELARARELVGDSLDAMRRLVRAMHPIELGDVREVEAFRAVAEAFRGTGIDVQVDVTGDDEPLARAQSLLLLRFVQEGLTNVVRHSDATSATLDLVVGSEGVHACLIDRGGRSTRSIVEGFGLRSLRSRVESVGGRLDASPTADGFRLALRLPREAA
ncbi:sensor histidine kinase [Salinibacterium soli]|uniref:histidine kinase n=1 Tax=Antiquaquibacter soli TaxID=3064523 RepID=A0ABT9BTK3_9MICO|nr:sensor histidine kinase [Protaetiibacter sp. WY-16]MDO7882687.1 sensor histidine kinase [Protaetiibacter sp. WY-16]